MRYTKMYEEVHSCVHVIQGFGKSIDESELKKEIYKATGWKTVDNLPVTWE